MAWNPFRTGKDEAPGSGAGDAPRLDAPRPDVPLLDATLVTTATEARPAAVRTGRDDSGAGFRGDEDSQDLQAGQTLDERNEAGRGDDSDAGHGLWQNRSALDESRGGESGDDGPSRPEEDFYESRDSEALIDDDPQPIGQGPGQPSDGSLSDAADLDFRDAYGTPDDRPAHRQPDDARTADDPRPHGSPADDPHRDDRAADDPHRDDRPTVDRPEPAPAMAAASASSLRTSDPEVTVVQSPSDADDSGATAVQPAPGAYDPIRVEQDRLAAERQARKEARLAALAPVQEQRPAAVTPVTAQKRVTDRFWPSLGLFLLRAVTGFTMGVHGVNKLLNPSAATDLFANTILPYPRYFAFGVGVIEVAIAIALLFGLLTRLAGLGVALIAGGGLGLVLWGAWSIFQPGSPGFVGEHELLLVAVGLLLLFVGGGAWSIDYGFRRRRAQVKAERQAMLDRP